MQLRFPRMPEQLTRADALILDYISNNTEGFLFSSIGQLARALGLSEATISRFVRHVGCSDFKDLKQVVMRQAAFEGPAGKIAATLNEGAEFTLSSWVARQQQNLQKTLEGLDEGEFAAAVRALLAARRVFIHAKSASASLGQLLFFRLRRLGIEVSLLPSGGSEVLEGLAQVRADDLVVLFSFSKLSREGRILLQYQREIGYRTLSFSSRAFLPEGERADINLFVYRGEAKEYHSMAAPAALVDALVVALSQQMGAESAQRLGRLHAMKRAYAPDR